MTEGQFLLDHLADVAKWIISKRDYAKQTFTQEVDDIPSEDIIEDNIHENRIPLPDFMDENGSVSIDLRLRWHEGTLHYASGNADYDQDHRGYCEASSVDWKTDDDHCADIALDMLRDLWNDIPEVEYNGEV